MIKSLLKVFLSLLSLCVLIIFLQSTFSGDNIETERYGNTNGLNTVTGGWVLSHFSHLDSLIFLTFLSGKEQDNGTFGDLITGTLHKDGTTLTVGGT